MALARRGDDNANAYYQSRIASDDPLSQAIDFSQRAAATGGDPQGMHAFTQALKERNLAVTPKSYFRGSDSTQFSPQGMSSTALDGLYDIANRKAKAAKV